MDIRITLPDITIELVNHQVAEQKDFESTIEYLLKLINQTKPVENEL